MQSIEPFGNGAAIASVSPDGARQIARNGAAAFFACNKPQAFNQPQAGAESQASDEPKASGGEPQASDQQSQACNRQPNAKRNGRKHCSLEGGGLYGRSCFALQLRQEMA